MGRGGGIFCILSPLVKSELLKLLASGPPPAAPCSELRTDRLLDVTELRTDRLLDITELRTDKVTDYWIM